MSRTRRAVVALARSVPVAFAAGTGVAAIRFAVVGPSEAALLFGAAAVLAVSVAVRARLFDRP